MKVQASSVEWALCHLAQHNDTDLFPSLVEYSVAHDDIKYSISKIASIELNSVGYFPCRRFVVPKGELSYRVATQLYPLDSIFLTAIIYEHGNLIERRRRPQEEQRVFSYRFAPSPDWRMYDSRDSWVEFWEHCKALSKSYNNAVLLDISDFYNQIYHHTIHNQLIESKLPNQITKWVMGLLEHITAKVSRGIPIGPHASHLLAEMSFIPIDNSMDSNGFAFCRFVDDIVIFCNSVEEAKVFLYKTADILDKQQRLVLQRSKTEIYNQEKFIPFCEAMIADQPIDEVEEEVLKIIREHSGGNPYVVIDKRNLPANDLKWFQKEHLEKVIDAYLKIPDPNFTRLRWFFRRLAQVGLPGAVEYCVQNLSKLIPALSDVCHYLISAADSFQGDWQVVGKAVLESLQHPIIKSNEYFQLSLMNLFSRNPSLNHLPNLVNRFAQSSNSIKREIILAACRAGASDWLRQLKEEFGGLNLWNQDAFIYSTHILPKEERSFFIRSLSKMNAWTDIVARWSKNR